MQLDPTISSVRQMSEPAYNNKKLLTQPAQTDRSEASVRKPADQLASSSVQQGKARPSFGMGALIPDERPGYVRAIEKALQTSSEDAQKILDKMSLANLQAGQKELAKTSSPETSKLAEQIQQTLKLRIAQYNQQIPAAPQPTDLTQAREVVSQDLAHVTDSQTASRHIELHTRKAADNHQQAHHAAHQAESCIHAALGIAQRLQFGHQHMPPEDLADAISQLEIHKIKASDHLNQARAYTQATYDEALYTHLAKETLLPRFPNITAQTEWAVASAWELCERGTEKSPDAPHIPAPSARLEQAEKLHSHSLAQIEAVFKQLSQ